MLHPYEICRRLERIADLSPDWVYWLGEEDDFNDYCYDCARMLRHPDGGFVDGGSGWRESDSIGCCDRCGRKLCTTLTDFAAGEEKHHFKSCWSIEMIFPDDLYCIAQLLSAEDDDTEVCWLAAGALQSVTKCTGIVPVAQTPK